MRDIDLTDLLRRELQRGEASSDFIKSRISGPSGVSVLSYESLLASGKQLWWRHNGYAYTSLLFEEVIKSFQFTNPIPNITTLRQRALDDYRREADKKPYGYKFKQIVSADFWLCEGGDVDLIPDLERLGLTSDVRLIELVREGDALSKIFRSAFLTNPLWTNLIQPGGMLPIPGNFFDILYKKAVETKESLVILGVVNRKEDYNSEEHSVVAHIA